MLVIQGLRKRFSTSTRQGTPVVALNGIDLNVQEGAFAAVLGASGSGKTTLLRCIAGFEEPDEGTISLANRDLTGTGRRSVPPHARGVGIVPQEGALFPHRSVEQNIAFGLVGPLRAQRRTRVAELLELVGMDGLGKRRPHELSGGQQQRVALARALAPSPKLLLLDEPFSALDAQLRAELREEVRNLLRAIGSTVVLVTHDQVEAMSMADHLIVLREGVAIAAGTPRSVYDSPVDTDLARFLGTANVLPGQVDASNGSNTVTCALGRLPIKNRNDVTGECDVLVRPDDLRIMAANEQPNAPLGASGRMVRESYMGGVASVFVTVDGLDVDVCVHCSGRSPLRVGDPVHIEVVGPVNIFPKERGATERSSLTSPRQSQGESLK